MPKRPANASAPSECSFIIQIIDRPKQTNVTMCLPHRQLFDGFLQPEADERGQGVVEDQQHDGTHKVVPLTLRVHHELPCVGAVALHDGGDAERAAGRQAGRKCEERNSHLSRGVSSGAYELALTQHCI